MVKIDPRNNIFYTIDSYFNYLYVSLSNLDKYNYYNYLKIIMNYLNLKK